MPSILLSYLKILYRRDKLKGQRSRNLSIYRVAGRFIALGENKLPAASFTAIAVSSFIEAVAGQSISDFFYFSTLLGNRLQHDNEMI